MYCESCGKKIAAGVKFCKNCGGKIRNQAQVEEDIIKDFKARNFASIRDKIRSIEDKADRDFIRKIEGDLDFVTGNYREAAKNYSAIPKNKRAWDVFFNLALINLNDNKTDEAAENLQAIKPQEAAPEKSLIYAERYKGKDALLADIQLYLGILYKDAGKKAGAIKSFEKAVNYGADSMLAHANLGDIYFKDDNYDLAISHYEAAIKTCSDPMKKSNLLNDLGFAYFRKGLTVDAVESFKKAVMMNPDNKNAVYNLGAIYIKDGMQDKMKDDYKEFLKHGEGVEIVFNLTRSMMEAAKQEAERTSSVDFIGEDASVKKIKEVILKAADTDSTVFIQGENGTGKELAARAIHKLSKRGGRPFIVVNCGALPETLLESELFGYEKGAFTGAVRDKPGRFEIADTGTVFLDEIGDITMAMQVKLLRFVQQREFERVGGNETKKVDVRIITATNRDIAGLVKEGKFREDLFYRLYVLPVVMPPLRERGKDIILLAEHFLRNFSEKYGKNFRSFSKEAIEAVLKYSWPGNVRQLENVIERTVTLHAGPEVMASFLPEEVLKASEGREEKAKTAGTQRIGQGSSQDLIELLKSVDFEHDRAAEILGISRQFLMEKIQEYDIKEIMARVKNNRTKAAKLLGVDRSTLWRRLKRK
jgi:sigma-54 specific flagellar transcriptional regulator A